MSRFVLVPRRVETTQGVGRPTARLVWRCGWMSLAVIVASLPAAGAAAQGGGAARSPRAGWLARDILTSTQPGTSADRAAADANLAAAEALVRKVGGYGTPRGFEITPWWQSPTIAARDRLAGYGLTIQPAAEGVQQSYRGVYDSRAFLKLPGYARS